MNHPIRIQNKYGIPAPRVGGVLIIDLEPIFRRYGSYRGLYPLYNVFPLKELISHILSTYYDQDVLEIINDEIDKRLSMDESRDYIDVMMRDLFLEALFDDLETHIQDTTCRQVDYADYSLDKWSGETTAVLVKPL